MKIFLKFLTWLLLFFSIFFVNAYVVAMPAETSSFLLNSKATPTATITVANTELCLGEQTIITFEGAGGNPNYSFTYTINNGAEQTIATENDQVSVSINTSITSSGTNVYNLIKVEDASGDIEVLDQDLTITVTDPASVDFNFTNDEVCSGETIQFTSDATGNGTLSYSWNFGDGTTSTEENPTKVYNVMGNGTQVFSVSLIVTDGNGCNTTKIKNIQVQRIPDIDFFSGSGGFVNCSDGGTDIFNLELFNSSVSSSEITSYTINWGDETAVETFNGFPTNGSGIMHSYSIGIFELSITAINANGCTNSITYDISNGSNPGGAFESPGSTVGMCLPMDDLIFDDDPLGFHLIILDWGTNPINTAYSVDFGDGNVQNFSQQDLEDSTFYNELNPGASDGYKVYHSYIRGSCSEPDGEFIATLTITNDCGDTSFTIDSINVLEPSEALFDVPSNIECINTPIEFENQTLIGDRANCTQTARFTWDFGDGTFINTPFVSTADNQTHTYTAAGNYTVKLTVYGDCEPDTYQEDICIEPEMIASYDLDTQEGCIPLAVSTQNTIDESELCSGPTYNWNVSYNNANCGTSEDWEFTNGTDASSENPQFLFNNPGEYTLTQNIITNCGTFSTQKVINVKKPPTAAINPIANLCQPAVLTPVAVVENCTDGIEGVTYSWTFSGGTPATSALQNPENISYDTGGTYTVTLEVTNECGVSNTATQQFEVLEKPVITNSPTTQEICSNQSTTPISLTASNTNSSFLWTATTVPNNPNITGFTSSGTSQVIPSQTIVNNGTTSGNVVYTVTPELNGCLGDPFEVLIVTVNPTPIITTQPVGSDICLDGAANVLEVVTQNGVGTPNYQWYASTTNTYDLTNPIAGATNSTYTPPTDTVGEVFYFVIIAFDGGCSDIQSDIVLVNTVAEPTATAVNPEQTICVDGQADTFTINLVGGLGNPTYQWFSNTTNTNSGGTAIAGATNSTYDTGVLSSIGTFYYYLEVRLDGTGCDLATSDVFTVNVVADPVIDTQAIASQEVCRNTTVAQLEITVSGDNNTGDFNYQWFVNTTNTNSGGTLVGTNTNTYTPDNSVVGTFFYYVVINQTASGCEVTSEVSTIIINEVPTITTQPIGSDICLDGAANTLEVVTENGVGTPTYQWYASTTNTYDLTNPIAGETNSTYTPPTNTVGEVFYFMVISFDGGCSDIQSTIALVNTVAEPIATAVDPEQTICLDGQATFEITITGGVGNPAYQWFSNTTNTNSGGTAITGATNSTYDTGVLSSIGTFYYYLEVSLDGAGCDLATSDVFTVNVVADPVIDTQAIASQEVCRNTTVAQLEITVSGDNNTGAFNYQWFVNTTNTNSGGTLVGTNTNTYTPDNSVVGTFFYYVVINQTASGCEVTSEVSTIIINEVPTITTQPIGSDICLDGAANTLEVVTENGVGTPTYQWYASTTNTYDLTNPIAGETNSTYTPPTNTVGEVFYFVVISFDGGCSDIQSTIALVNTVAEPIATAVDPEQIICLDGQADTFEITITGGVGNPAYQWFSNTTNTNSGGTAITGATNSTYDTGVLSSIGTFYYYLEVRLDGTGCDLATSDVFTVNVVADPVIDTQAIASQEVCRNTTVAQLEITVSGDNNTGDFNYQWFVNTTNTNSGGTLVGTNTNTYTPDNSVVGTFFYYVVINQTASGCEVTSEVSTIIINEVPTITTQPIGSDICLDGAANTLEVVTENGVGTPTYQWYASTTNTYDLTNPIAGETNSTYTPPTNTVGEVFYFMVISFDGGCSDIQSTIALVNTVAEPIATAVDPEQTICLDGQATFEITITGGVGNPAYQWFSNTTNTNSGGTAITGATNSTYDTGVLSSIGAFYHYLEVSLDGTGCDLATSDVFTVNVVADPVIDTQAIASQEVCRNTTVAQLEITVSGDNNTGDFNYQWFVNTTNTNSGGTLVGTNTNTYTPDNSVVGTFFYYVVINQTASGCEVTSEVSTIIINEVPTITTQPIGSDICLDGAANTLEVVTENGVGTPTYQWYASTTNTYDLTNPIAGETNSTYTPPTNTVGEVFYFVVISFDGGCSDIQSTIALVNTVAEPIATAVDPEQTICLDGQATFEITITGGVGNPAYQWFSNTTNTNSGGTAITGATNSTYDTGVLSSIGTFYYYLEVSLDGAGCDLATSDVFTVNVVADPVIDTQAIASQEVCRNTTVAQLEITVSGDNNTGAFNYQWFVNTTNTNSGGTLVGTNTNTYTPDNSVVGTFFYYVVINQTASGCEVTSEVSTIIINEVPTITTQPIGSDICLDGAANTLEVVTENGVGTPTYQWYASTTNTYDLTNPIAGETNSTYTPPTNTVGEVFYFVVISFDGGCSNIQSTIALVNVNQFPVIDFDQITIYSEETFLFDPNLVASNIVPAGTTYTWSAPTSSTPGAILGSSAEISPQTNISQTLENIEIFPVIETYIITPATPNCTGNPFTLEVTVNPKIISNVLVTNNTCFESNDGVITTNITGGVPFTRGTPYLISWTGPNSFTSTASSISNLMAGIYTLRIEDRNGVSITEQYTVTQPDLLAITTDLEQNISCFEGSDGAIEISISGGTLSYSFKWTTTDGAGIVQGNEDQSGLNAGTYNLELTDNNACVSTKTFILTEPKAIRISTVLKEDILCFGDATGAIEIAVTGGTPIEVSSGVFEYTYSWSGPNGFTSNVQNISNLFIGTYTIEVTDELGCLKRTDIELTQPTAIEIDYTKTDATCYGGADGSIDVTVTGGRPPYQISWSNLGNSFSQSNLSAGNYVATIVDENKCEANVTITIEQPIFFIESIVSPISCNNASDASIVLNLRGGIAPFTVLWSDDPSAGLQRNNLSPGTYSVTIADSAANQCPIQQTFLFTDPPVIGVSETITDATDCNIVNSGSINLNVSGGTKPYSFLWNTNQITKDLTNIPPGDYSVEIKDKNNCVINKQFSIYRQEPIEVEFLVTEIPDCDLKTVSQRTVAKVTGGFPPYTYSWSAGSVSITDNTIMTTSQQGSYTLTITDGKGCTESKIFLVDLPTIGNADYSYDAFSIDNYNLLSIEDPVQFTNLTIGNYSNITWDFGDGSPTTSDENPVHIYDQVGIFNVVLKIELDFGCIEIIEKTLNITQGYVLINPNAFTPNNDGYNETIRPSFTGFKEIEMTIYDTWGVPIYYENNLELNGWDGTIKGLPAENGNYVMVVKGNTFYEKKIITITALTLLK